MAILFAYAYLSVEHTDIRILLSSITTIHTSHVVWSILSLPTSSHGYHHRPIKSLRHTVGLNSFSSRCQHFISFSHIDAVIHHTVTTDIFALCLFLAMFLGLFIRGRIWDKLDPYYHV
jgi:hypothetical protein